MKNLLSSFYSLLPVDLKTLISSLNEDRIKVGFIGGVVRDYIMYNHISNDIDLELRSASPIDMAILAKELNGKLNLEFNIITIKLSSCTVELGLPRIETFSHILSHKNFSFKHSNGYDKEFLRRDFTVNAILFEFYNNEMHIFDPLCGLGDLENGVLKPCSSDFTRDPVRMLRAYRFKNSKSFSFAPQLVTALQDMSQLDCSSFYILKEASKSQRPLSFFRDIKLIDSYNENSIYNNTSFSLKEALEREPSVTNKKELMSRLSLSSKNLIPSIFEVNDFYDCFDLFKYFLKNQMSDPEIVYILKLIKLDHSAYCFKNLINFDLNFNSSGMSADSKKKKFIELILKEATL